MKVEGIELIAEEIDGWIQTRKIIGARKGVDKIQYIDLINDNIIECQELYKKYTGSYYEG